MRMNYWLMKSEPNVFSWDDCAKQGRSEWDGVRSHQAQNNMKAMKKGDQVLFYHSNIGLEVVGIAEIVGEASPDSTDDTGKWIAVDLETREKLPQPVTLKAMKAEPALADMAMIRQSRLSVSPVREAEFKHILKMGGM